MGFAFNLILKSVRRDWPIATMTAACAMMLAAAALVSSGSVDARIGSRLAEAERTAAGTATAPSPGSEAVDAPRTDGASGSARPARDLGLRGDRRLVTMSVRLDGAASSAEDALAASVAASRFGGGYLRGGQLTVVVDADESAPTTSDQSRD